MKKKEIVGIRVNVSLVRKIAQKLNYSPNIPINYAVDGLLRELLSRLEKEQENVAQHTNAILNRKGAEEIGQ